MTFHPLTVGAMIKSIKPTCAEEHCIAPKYRKSKYCQAHKAIARERFSEMLQTKAKEKQTRDLRFKIIWEDAHEKGLAAGNTVIPVPMVVIERENMFDDTSPITRQYTPIEGGPCGFAWVTVHPGNSSFALWCKREHRASRAYAGGMTVKWVSEFGQSVTRKSAYAYAFASALQEAGITAYAGDRLD